MRIRHSMGAVLHCGLLLYNNNSTLFWEGYSKGKVNSLGTPWECYFSLWQRLYRVLYEFYDQISIFSKALLQFTGQPPLSLELTLLHFKHIGIVLKVPRQKGRLRFAWFTPRVFYVLMFLLHVSFVSQWSQVWKNCLPRMISAIYTRVNKILVVYLPPWTEI